jgi:hypothetical protein
MANIGPRPGQRHNQRGSRTDRCQEQELVRRTLTVTDPLTTGKIIMQVQVESQTNGNGIENPRRLRLDGRTIEVIENVDRWFGPDYCYFKVKGDDGNLYILRLDEARGVWELIMFQNPLAETFAAIHAAARQ